jgi:succinoglycan biosynthesis protein ExoV
MDSLERGDWAEVCRLAGVTFLDPGAPVPDLLAMIRSARFVVTEAMHGAIVADALRTPWIGVMPFHDLHRPKWLDWSESLGIDIRFVRLLPSSLREAYTLATGKAGGGLRSRMLFDSAPSAPVNLAMRHIAAKNLLRVIERIEPQLSRDDRIESVTARCEEALERFIQRRQLTRQHTH